MPGDLEEWIIARDRSLLMPKEAHTFPSECPPGVTSVVQMVGRWNETWIRAAAAPKDAPAPDGWQWVTLRSLCGVLDDGRLGLAGRALQMLDWELNNAFCGRCGAGMATDASESCRRCTQCGFSAYPRIEPAAIVAVVRSPREILLARTSRLPEGVHSILAGFVEPGESLEQCAAREVFEETGIRIRNVRYVGSQSWPFPRSLMVGFIAEYESGEIRIDPTELVSAAWFSLDELPPVPGPISIARALIDLARETAL